MEEAWRCAYASVTGSSHERTGTPCQDAGLCRVVRSPGGASILLAVASDGAGSAARSADGARLAVDLFMEDFAGPLERGESIRQIDRGFVTSWIERLRRESSGRFPDKVTAFHGQMTVHGRFRQPCPDCGAPVQRIVYAANECNYCARCQTGGRVLADRSLSRLLGEDWPRSIDEM